MVIAVELKFLDFLVTRYAHFGCYVVVLFDLCKSYSCYGPKSQSTKLFLLCSQSDGLKRAKIQIDRKYSVPMLQYAHNVKATAFDASHSENKYQFLVVSAARQPFGTSCAVRHLASLFVVAVRRLRARAFIHITIRSRLRTSHELARCSSAACVNSSFCALCEKVFAHGEVRAIAMNGKRKRETNERWIQWFCYFIVARESR